MPASERRVRRVVAVSGGAFRTVFTPATRDAAFSLRPPIPRLQWKVAVFAAVSGPTSESLSTSRPANGLSTQFATLPWRSRRVVNSVRRRACRVLTFA